MCVSLAPAILSKTTLVVGEAKRRGRSVHVLGYQNTAQSLAPIPQVLRAGGPGPGLDHFAALIQAGKAGGKPKPKSATGNAMILPFPALERMGPANLIDTSRSKRVLKDIAETVRPMSRSRAPVAMGMRNSKDAVQVFDHGIYTCVFGYDPDSLFAALDLVPEAKRPPLELEMLEAYARWYPGWPLGIECFDNRQAIEADPLLFWYVPAFPFALFAPTLESHTGGVPNLDEEVTLDHTIAVGMPEGRGETVNYSDKLSEDLRELLPRHVRGDTYESAGKNADFFFLMDDVKAGKYDPSRLKPGNNPAIDAIS